MSAIPTATAAINLSEFFFIRGKKSHIENALPRIKISVDTV